MSNDTLRETGKDYQMTLLNSFKLEILLNIDLKLPDDFLTFLNLINDNIQFTKKQSFKSTSFLDILSGKQTKKTSAKNYSKSRYSKCHASYYSNYKNFTRKLIHWIQKKIHFFDCEKPNFQKLKFEELRKFPKNG